MNGTQRGYTARLRGGTGYEWHSEGIYSSAEGWYWLWVALRGDIQLGLGVVLAMDGTQRGYTAQLRGGTGYLKPAKGSVDR